MSNSVNGAALRTHEKSLRDRLSDVAPKAARVRTAERNDEIAPQKRRGGAIVREALRTADVSLEAFRIDAGQKSNGVVSEALSDQTARHTPLEWVLSQTDQGFRVAFLELLQAEWGLAPERQHDVEINLAVALFDRLVRVIESKNK